MKSKKLLVIAPALMAMSALVGCKGGANEFTVTFDTQGGTQIASVIVKKGEKVTKPATNPKKDWNYFNDWYKAKDGSDKFDFESAINSNVTIYAHYDATTLKSIETQFKDSKMFYYGDTFTKKDDLLVYAYDSKGQKYDVTNDSACNKDNIVDSVTFTTEAEIGYERTLEKTPSEQAVSYTHDGVTESQATLLTNNLGTRFDVNGAGQTTQSARSNGNSVGYVKISAKGLDTSTPWKKVKSDSSITSIADNGFQNNTDITKVDLPNTITSIGVNAFQNCTNLEEINIPSGCTLTNFGNNCFENCNNLKTLTIDEQSVYDCTTDARGLLLKAEKIYIPIDTVLGANNYIENSLHLTKKSFSAEYDLYTK